MDLFRTPGASLEGADRKKFDDTKELIDSATNDFLVRADWNANMGVVDKVNSLNNTTVLNEIMFLLRKKLSTKSAQTVGLTMQLIGSLVNNCGARFHAALNEEKFTREIGNAVRYFGNKAGSESKDVTDISLDLIQSWGEAFLPRRKQFYNIVDLYFTLRKEGLPFKVQQFDPSRVPIFSDNSPTPRSGEDTDAILAAALQSSMALEMEAEEKERRRENAYSDNRPTRPHHSHNHTRNHNEGAKEEAGFTSIGSNTAEEVVSLKSCMSILKDLIQAATHHKDFRHNEIADEVMTQLQSYQSKMTNLIETALMNDPENVETLITLNETSHQLSGVYNQIKNCEINLVEGQRRVATMSCGDTEQQSQSPAAAVDHHQQPHQGDMDLLGLDEFGQPSPVHRSSPHPHPHVPHHHHHHHNEEHSRGAHSPVHHNPQHMHPPPQAAHGHHSAPSPVHHYPEHPHTHAHPTHQHPHAHPHHHVVPVRQAPLLAPPPQQAHRAPIPAPIHTPAPAQANHQVHQVHHNTPVAAPVPALHTVRSDEVVTPIGGDPFAPDALDALFSDTPPVHTHAPTAHHTVARAANNESTEEILPQPKDHFAPEALDSLFDTPKPPAVSGQKADPFSDAALDALFDTPAPPTHPHPQHGAQYGHGAHGQGQGHHLPPGGAVPGYPQHSPMQYAPQQYAPQYAAAHSNPQYQQQQYAPQYQQQQQYPPQHGGTYAAGTGTGYPTHQGHQGHQGHIPQQPQQHNHQPQHQQTKPSHNGGNPLDLLDF